MTKTISLITAMRREKLVDDIETNLTPIYLSSDKKTQLLLFRVLARRYAYQLPIRELKEWNAYLSEEITSLTPKRKKAK